MANEQTWQCSVCKYKSPGARPPAVCPVCGAQQENFKPLADGGAFAPPTASDNKPDLAHYLSEWTRPEYEDEEKFSIIQKLAITARSEISPMGTRKPFPGLDTILFKGAQFLRFPLNEDDPVNTRTVIGPKAQHPLELTMPFYVSHMSFGALSREAKVALAMGATAVGTATCSGEGGLLPEERKAASHYIYEIGTAPFTDKPELVAQADAVEIKFGQAAKPGMGGHLPAEKVTEEIGKIRGLAPGEDFISPNRQLSIESKWDLRTMVTRLREQSGGKPIGVKFTAGHIEEDLDFVLFANPDFFTIDCRGGATGAAPSFIRDHVCLPPVYAIRRARLHLDKLGSKVTFCVTGGFRDSTDIAKALALGADAVALATTSLIAIGCQQYRICNTGKCPVGITTQDPELRKRLSIELSRDRFVNFFKGTNEELMALARINGRSDVADLDLTDIFTLSNEVSKNSDIASA